MNGYTDTSGTPRYNQGLSVRRAQAVAGELVRDGVPAGAISIQGFGETNLLVPYRSRRPRTTEQAGRDRRPVSGAELRAMAQSSNSKLDPSVQSNLIDRVESEPTPWMCKQAAEHPAKPTKRCCGPTMPMLETRRGTDRGQHARTLPA